jgi:endonuclease/exonuclease/phosphatase family metal-dependent hydrolase
MRRLRVVSWNVGRLYTPTSNNRLDDADVPQVARTLDELDPEVVLLQELTGERQLTLLLDALPGYDGALAILCRYDRHTAVLARRALAPEFEQHLLAETGRGLVMATFSIGEARGCASSLHFDVFDKWRRRSQAEELARLVGERQEPLMVVGGDLNLDPELAARLADPIDTGTYSLLRDRFCERGREPTLLGLLRVDHLFARGARMKELWTRVSPGRRLPMGDHDPLVGDLELSRID